MKYCPNCGKSEVGGMKYCPQCGQSLTGFDLEEKQRYVHQPEAPPKKSGMRIAAGILMIIFGMFLLIGFVSVLIDYGSYDLAFDLFVIIASVFIVTGGGFCLMRKVWGLCLASALVAIFVMIFWLMGSRLAETWLTWLISIVGTLPIIFVCVRKREWSESKG